MSMIMRKLNQSSRSALQACSEAITVMKVEQTTLAPWKRPGKPMILKMTHSDLFSEVIEWVSLDGEGLAREFAADWWMAMGGKAPAPTVLEAIARKDELWPVKRCGMFQDGDWQRVAWVET